MSNTKNILDKWLDSRYESLSQTSTEDYMLIQKFNKHRKNILKRLPKNKHNYINNELEKNSDAHLLYASNYMKRFYKYGFKDCMKLIICSIEEDDQDKSIK